MQENIEQSGSGVEQKSGISHLFNLLKIDFNFQLFGILRVSPVRFDGSPSWYLTFYLNLSGRGVPSLLYFGSTVQQGHAICRNFKM